MLKAITRGLGNHPRNPNPSYFALPVNPKATLSLTSKYQNFPIFSSICLHHSSLNICSGLPLCCPFAHPI